MDEEITFTTTMRRATRKAHAISDALVNTKLLFALYDNKVWADGLLIFYEIFKFLEVAMREKKDENLGKLHVPELDRTSAFEEDLKFYLGENWKKTYTIRDSVKNYLKHLKFLYELDSDLLMPYVYHLYMGLLSGGQILTKKREIQNRIIKTEKEGHAITNFEGISISSLKQNLRDKMNEIADTLDFEKKAVLLEESLKVFEYNNSIIKTVQNTEVVAYKNFFFFASCVFLILGILFYYLRYILREIAHIFFHR